METKRLDVYLAQNGFCRSRSLAAVLIKNKRVRVNGQTVCKTSYPVSEDDRVCVDAAEETEFVGRGGKKLKKALDELNARYGNGAVVKASLMKKPEKKDL